MFEDEAAPTPSPRRLRPASPAGLGAIARTIVCEGQEIPARKLTFAEAEGRVRPVHQPYARRAWPSSDRRDPGAPRACSIPDPTGTRCRRRPQRGRNGEACDFVLGDRFGAACAGAVAQRRRARARRDGLSRGAQHALRRRLHHRALRPSRPQGSRAPDRDQPARSHFDARRGDGSSTAGFKTLKTDLERLFAVLAAAGLDAAV